MAWWQWIATYALDALLAVADLVSNAVEWLGLHTDPERRQWQALERPETIRLRGGVL